MPTWLPGAFWILSDLLDRSPRDRTDCDRTLLCSEHWFAASKAHVGPVNQLFNLITWLEALAGPNRGVPIGSSVADGVVLVVA